MLPVNPVSLGYNPWISLFLKNDMYQVDSWERLHLVSKEIRTPEVIFKTICKMKIGVSNVINLSDVEPNLLPILETLAKNCCHKTASHASSQMLAKQDLKDFPVKKLNLFRFLRNWVLKFIPVKLLGDKTNLGAFIKNMRYLITRGKMGRVRLKSLLCGLKVERVGWMNNLETLAAQQMLAKLVKFLSEKVIWRVIKSFFHISDTSWGKQELFFFRKRQFQSRLDQALDNLQSKQALKWLNSERKICQVQNLPQAPVQTNARMMPKHSGFRLISWKKDSKSEKLLKFRTLLSYLKNRYGESVDVRGKGLHKVWMDFIKNVDGDEQVFFVRTDIKDAFPSIKLKHLENVLENVGAKSPDKLYYHKVVYKTRESRMITKHLVSEILHGSSPDIPKNCKLVSVSHQVLDVKVCLTEIGKRCRLQTIRFQVGKKSRIFLQTQGLVQGDSLSKPNR